MAAPILPLVAGGAAQSGSAGGALGKIGGGALSGGASILGGFLKARAEERKRQRELAAKEGAEARGRQAAGVQNLSQGQQAALSNLVQNFGRALGV